MNEMIDNPQQRSKGELETHEEVKKFKLLSADNAKLRTESHRESLGLIHITKGGKKKKKKASGSRLLIESAHMRSGRSRR